MKPKTKQILETENLGTYEENKKAFEEWFHELMFMEGMTCLLRDVLRANKENLFKSWMEVRPWRF